MPLLSGCGSLGSAATDVALVGAGGAVGYAASDQKIGGAAIGAAGGYIASKIVQNEVTQAVNEAEQYGYDRAMHQAVKQQYWIIQNMQKLDTEGASEGRMVAVTLPETLTEDGTILKPSTEYIRTQP
jgi:hypothetical protein